MLSPQGDEWGRRAFLLHQYTFFARNHKLADRKRTMGDDQLLGQPQKKEQPNPKISNATTALG